jgi:membrane-associated phospholipid phosphatase
MAPSTPPPTAPSIDLVTRWAQSTGLLSGPKRALIKTDIHLSNYIFTHTKLPPLLEWCLSIPACIFGAPYTMTILILTLALTEPTESNVLACLLCLETCCFLLAWMHYLPKPKGIKIFFKTNPILALFIVFNLATVQYFASARTFGFSCFFVSAFSIIVGVVAPLKKYTWRLRPHFYPEDRTKAHEKIFRAMGPSKHGAFPVRHLDIGPDVIQSTKTVERTLGDQHAALPSGDAAACATYVVSFVLHMMDGETDFFSVPNRLLLCVLYLTLVLCCVGRMYWRHHHLLDVICGSLVGIGSTLLLYFGWLGGIGPIDQFGWATTLICAVVGAALNEFTAS